MRVLGVTRARIASTSAVSAVSGATTGVPPDGEDGDPVDQKSVLGEDRLVAGRKVGLRDQRQQLVGAVAADDAVRD